MMKNSNWFVFVLFFLGCSGFSIAGFSQRVLANQEAEVTLAFPLSFSTFLLSKKYTVPYSEDNPKKLKEEDLFFFNPAWYIEQNRKEKGTNPFFASARFYTHETILDTLELPEKTNKEEYIQTFGYDPEVFIGDHHVQVREMKQEWVNHYFQPFYFKKWEVTNVEYRDFVNDVIEAKAHQLLGQVNADGSPDRKQKINWAHPRLDPLFPGADRKINPQQLVYVYEEEGTQRSVAIYPDTACWTNDWVYSYNEPMTRNYFSSKAFDHYPVVGINYYQAQAFCHWKTQQLNQQYPKGPPLKVELPSQIEWEWISSLSDKNGRTDMALLDEEWITDLLVDARFRHQDARLLSRRTSFENQFVVDGFTYTSPANLKAKDRIIEELKNKRRKEQVKLLFSNLDLDAISGMGNNVSEWMQESYPKNWQSIFKEELARLQRLEPGTSQLTIQAMLHFDRYCDKDGQLVCGSNWVDERYTMFGGKNRAGIQAKTFVAPEKAHSTIGFRYVVRFEE